MSDLGFNKIAGAVLATGLAVLGLRELSNGIYAPRPAAKPGYAIQVAETTAGAPAEAPDVPPDWGTVLPTANVQAGQEQSTKCMSCHSFAKGGANGTGPDNWGVVGRQPGTHPGFDYSSAMKDFGAKHPTWTYDELYNFLKSPQAYVSGTKMTFVGLKKPEDRVNLIAWLRLQSDSPAPIPPPNPKAAAAPAAAAAAGTPASGAPAAAAGQDQAPKSGAAAAPAPAKAAG
jgi:cytochrome c